MELLLQFTLALAIVVVAAKASGYLSGRLGQPAVLGELLIGLLRAPRYSTCCTGRCWGAATSRKPSTSFLTLASCC